MAISLVKEPVGTTPADPGIPPLSAPSLPASLLRSDEQPSRAATASADLAPRLFEEELSRAAGVHQAVTEEMRKVFAALRQQQGLPVDGLEDLVAEMLDSLSRCPDALLVLSRLQSSDADYLLQHSVAVSVLLMRFGHNQGLSRPKLRHLGLAGLLHDIGHARLPGKVNNKGTKLTTEEFALMQQHVEYTQGMLAGSSLCTPVVLEVAEQHHERVDGSGYPHGLKGEEIGRFGQMAGIVDVYEAMTSLRPFHRGLPGTDVLRMLFQWSNGRFSRELVQAFIATVGIYPTGSLVRLHSDRLGIVLSQHPTERLRPRVKVIYNLRDNHFLEPRIVDLRLGKDHIVGHESYEHRGVDARRWILH